MEEKYSFIETNEFFSDIEAKINEVKLRESKALNLVATACGRVYVMFDKMTTADFIRENIYDIVRNGKNFVFYGGPGTGKTGSSAVLLKELYIKYNIKGFYTKASAIIRAILKDEEDILHKCKTSDFLIIDEFDKRITANRSNWEVCYLFDILDYRIVNKKSTILITNLQPTEWLDAFGAPLTDRLLEFKMVDFGKKSLRRKENESDKRNS